MSKKKVSKASTRRLFTIGIVSLFLVFYFVFTSFEYIIGITKLSNEEKKLEQELYKLKDNEEELKIEITKLNDPAYIADYARKHYHYSRDGEYIIQINDQYKEIEEPKKENFDYKNIFFISAFSLIIIIVGRRLIK